MLILDIDYRESKILYLINSTIEIKVSNIIHGPIKKYGIEFYYKISNLPIGDFIIKEDNKKEDENNTQDNQKKTDIQNESDIPNEDNQNKQNEDNQKEETKNVIYFMIERKNIADLACSIVDNRFREQKNRLSETNNKIIYIIEGLIHKSRNKIPFSTLKSSIINLMCKHNFQVFKTENEDDTLEYLLLLYKKTHQKEFINEQIQHSNMGKKKSESQNIFVNQLMMINGVSYIIAFKLYEIYKNMYNFIHSYDNLLINECENLLTNIQINEKRKIGKALSKKIYHNLINLNDNNNINN
jgi:ERCC4-type nuclease